VASITLKADVVEVERAMFIEIMSAFQRRSLMPTRYRQPLMM
jgi:hypothetical protein